MTDTPETWNGPQISDDDAEDIRAVNRIVTKLRRQIDPRPILGYATEHSIEDPFTGDITVSVRLA